MMKYVSNYMHPEDFLSRQEFKRLLFAARTDRERAILMLLGGCGLRISEVAALRAEHVSPEDGFIYVVNGKGHKDRTVVAPAPVFAALKSLTIDSGPLFPGGYRGGHITPRQIANIIDRIAIDAGLQETRPPAKGKVRERKRVTPHLLRHSYASWLLDIGGSVSDLQDQLGHSSLATTGIYLKRRPNHRREALQAVGIDKMV
jgi:integrase/recombinase XerD